MHAKRLYKEKWKWIVNRVVDVEKQDEWDAIIEYAKELGLYYKDKTYLNGYPPKEILVEGEELSILFENWVFAKEDMDEESI